MPSRGSFTRGLVLVYLSFHYLGPVLDRFQGADFVLEKPSDIDELIEKLDFSLAEPDVLWEGKCPGLFYLLIMS